jgi:hypothetical protein
MPFVAVHRETRKRLSLHSYANPREEIEDFNEYRCAITDLPVVPVRQHFRDDKLIHSYWRTISNGNTRWPDDLYYDEEYVLSRDPDTGVVRVGESLTHQAGKRFVAEKLAEIYPDCFPEWLRFEHKVVIPTKDKKRIADVAYVFPFGGFIVGEVQISKITAESIRQRTMDYFDSGAVSVEWFVSSKIVTPAIEQAYFEITGDRFYVLHQV